MTYRKADNIANTNITTVRGSKKAKGIAVIIDVFRAFTTECFL